MDSGGNIPERRKSRCKVPEVRTHWICLRSQCGWSRVRRGQPVWREGREEQRARTGDGWRGLQPKRHEDLWEGS